MKQKTKLSWLYSWINYYIAFFLLVAFVITCCMMLFVSTLSRTF